MQRAARHVAFVTGEDALNRLLYRERCPKHSETFSTALWLCQEFTLSTQMLKSLLWYPINTFPALLQFANWLFCEHTLHIRPCALVGVAFLPLVFTHQNHTHSSRWAPSLWKLLPSARSAGVSTPHGLLLYPELLIQLLLPPSDGKLTVVKIHLLSPLLVQHADWLGFTLQSVMIITILSADIPSSICEFTSCSSIHLLSLVDTTARDRAQQITACGPSLAHPLVL